MRFFSDDSQHRPTEPDLAQAARELLVARPFRNDDHDRDTRLERLIKAALSGPEGPETARVLSRNFVLAVANGDTYASAQHGFLQALFSQQPVALLDEIGTGDLEHIAGMRRLIRDAARFGDNPIDVVPVDILLSWCRKDDPAFRFELVASIVTPVQGGMDGAVAAWTPAASALLDGAPDRVAVLENLLQRFHPMSWSGSLAAILETRAELLGQLSDHPDARLAARAIRAYDDLQLAIATGRQEETRHDQLRDERFEYD